ncbi:MAG: bacillithiol system redox-active protein YtxJ [Chitinophagaceae bacterium]
MLITWKELIRENQLPDILEATRSRPILIYKHSSRCSISAVVKTRLEQSSPPPGMDMYLLDILEYRGISGKLADQLGIRHESPQILLIKNGKCIYNESHYAINMENITSNLELN